jgi:hypothetical protein
MVDFFDANTSAFRMSLGMCEDSTTMLGYCKVLLEQKILQVRVIVILPECVDLSISGA